MNADLETLINVPISPECFVSIVIPVRDEAEHLPETLECFAKQINLQNEPLDSNLFEIIVLANNCSDDSARLARNWKKRNEKINIHIVEINLPPENATVGFVRRMLMNEAFHRLRQTESGKGIIMTTDGDTRVAPDWIAQTIKEIVDGADAVGGRILLEKSELEKMNEKARYFHLFDEEYRLLVAEFECLLDAIPHDTFPRHHQHFNGSFAVTTVAFERAGGVPEVGFLEDVAFYHALLRIDAKVRHSPQVKVFTSARNVGRSEVGLSFQINEWAIMGKNGDIYLVEAADAIEKRTSARKILREFWQASKSMDFPKFNSVAALAETLGVPAELICTELEKPQTFGNLLEKIYGRQNEIGEWQRQNNFVAVETAIADLNAKLKNLRDENKSFKKSCE